MMQAIKTNSSPKYCSGTDCEWTSGENPTHNGEVGIDADFNQRAVLLQAAQRNEISCSAAARTTVNDDRTPSTAPIAKAHAIRTDLRSRI